MCKSMWTDSYKLTTSVPVQDTEPQWIMIDNQRSKVTVASQNKVMLFMKVTF